VTERRKSPPFLLRPEVMLGICVLLGIVIVFVSTYGLIQRELAQLNTESGPEVAASLGFVRRAFVALAILLVILLACLALLFGFTIKAREASALATQRLGRLARSIQPLSAALEHDPGAVLLVDDEGTVVYANTATRDLMGIEGRLIGQQAREIFERFHSDLREALVSGLDAIVTLKPSAESGREEETLLVSSRPITIEQRPHFLYTMRPVTREVRRQELEHWKKLIRVLSHELNNSIAPIVSLMNTAQKINAQSEGDPRLTEIFDTIGERTGHLLSFLDSYRSIARLPLPTLRFVRWDEFVEGLRAHAAFRVEGPLPKTPGLFDPVQFERVLINALTNAKEAGGPVDEIVLSITESPAGTRVEVRDRGTGMSEATLRQATLPFFSTKPGGTGIGLALSREIVEAHGGQLTLSNREGGGLTVAIQLPPARAGFLGKPQVHDRSEAQALDPGPASLTLTRELTEGERARRD
jgi:two-component system nitrogen regulation sensor histidine kinase NtrY